MEVFVKNSVKLTVDISPSVDESEVIISAKEETALALLEAYIQKWDFLHI